MVEGTFDAIDILYTYVTIFCSWRITLQDFMSKVPEANLVLEMMVGGHLVPIALALMTLVRWFEGKTVADRTANQYAALNGTLAAIFAWSLAVLVGLSCQEALSSPGWEQMLSNWTCWQGPPFPNVPAAAGVALGSAAWRRNWRWGLACFLVTGFGVSAQACLGQYYPMDIVVGMVIGASLGWMIGISTRLNRLMGVFIRLARYWLLA
ncbi:MAG: hypothetical protein GY832_04010 [Chloroflexi bacterium]|nr:hypothetical protein [Chloroflexota bacterium]